ncbi:MAG: hypothetical protein NC416_16075 [Eubacterium sp.]|nr:hypothetical protein [Eubacterium sp.]
MNKEMVNMTNEEMFLALMGRMDGVDRGLAKLDSKIDRLESRLDKVESRLDKVESRLDKVENRLDHLSDKIDKMESDINMEIQAVRVEMEVVNKSLKMDIGFLNEKIDHIMILKDVDGIDKMKIRLDVLEQGYRKIKEKIG